MFVALPFPRKGPLGPNGAATSSQTHIAQTFELSLLMLTWESTFLVSKAILQVIHFIKHKKSCSHLRGLP